MAKTTTQASSAVRTAGDSMPLPIGCAGGSGLGLSIAQSAAQRCGLRLTLHNREDRPGLVARLEATACVPATR